MQDRTGKRPIRTGREMLWFVASAYLLTWLWTAPFVWNGAIIAYGQGWPTHFPSLLGPMLAAMFCAYRFRGGAGLRDLLGRMARWRVEPRWWLWAVGSPAAYFAIGAGAALFSTGSLPDLSGLGRFNGLPEAGPLAVWVILTVINGFGEETGWRGFALPTLERRYSPLAASLILAPIWALWHLPFFYVLENFRGLGVGGVVGLVIGLSCGAIVLAWIYHRSGESILIAAVWHGTFNLAAGSMASVGTIAAVVSSLVMVQAILLAILELRARRAGKPTVIGPRTG